MVVQTRVDKEEPRLLLQGVNAGTAEIGGREQSDEEDVLVSCEEGGEADFS